MENIGITLSNLKNDFKASLLDIFDGHEGNDIVK